MGLMFIFPVSEEETDRVEIKDKMISLKSYGLPMVFWAYLAAILVVIGAMGLAIQGPILKLLATPDPINQALALGAATTIILIPVLTLCFYFYEKTISKIGNKLTLTHKVFWVPLYTKVITLKDKDALEILHFMDSPNVAKMQQDPTMKGFENKGYFQLFARTIKGNLTLVDRSSRKADLKKMVTLLNKY